MNGTLLGLLIPVVAAEFGCSTEVTAWIQLGPQFTSAMLGPSIGMASGGRGAENSHQSHALHRSFLRE
jgi:hypothetical protein